MASVAVGVTITSGVPGALTGLRPNSVTAAQIATVDTDVGVLVADGATPTQAHVTTLNTDWTALKAGKDVAPADVTLIVNTANCTTMTALRQALNLLVANFSGALTP